MRSTLGIALTSLALVAALPARAQIVNVLTPRVEAPEQGFGFSLDQAAELRQGNTEFLTLAADLGVGYVHGDHQLKLLTAADLKFVDGQRKLNHQFGHLRYIWRFHDNLSLYLFAQLERDEFRRMELRAVGGAGMEVELAATDWIRAALAISIMPEFERLKEKRIVPAEAVPLDPLNPRLTTEQVTTDNYTTRLSPYFTLAIKLSPWLTLASTTILQPGMPDGDFRVFHEDTLLVSVTKHFGLTLSFNATHDSDPPLGVDNTDLSLKQGISLKF